MEQQASLFVRNRKHLNCNAAYNATCSSSSVKKRIAQLGHRKGPGSGAMCELQPGPNQDEEQEEVEQEEVRIRRTRRIRVKKSKPILGIAIEGGFEISGQLLPRILFVHEDGAAYRCGKIRAGDLILEVNGISTVNMTHKQIAQTIANSYYQDQRPYIEFLIGESTLVQ